MSSPVPSPNVNYVFPTQVILLGEALVSVAIGARKALKCKAHSSGHEFVTLQDLSRHIRVIQHTLTRLSSRLDGLMTNVICNESAGAIEAGRAAGRFEQVLSELVDGYLDVKSSHASPDSSEARTLVLGVYRHYIREICEWLEELVAVIAQPAAAIQQRGLDVATGTELTIELNITIPPEMAKLDALAKRFLYPPSANSESARFFEQRCESRPVGLLHIFGALAFGISVTSSVLD